MGPIFAFFTGVAALGTSFGLGIKEKNDNELAWEAERAAGYSYAAQSQYDFNRGKLYQAYYIEKIIEEVQKDYPKMNDFCAREVAEAAVAKRLLEEETRYKYKPSENCKFFNLEKYVREEFRKSEEDWWK